MLRTALGVGAIALLLATAGCRMCCHPYDYCGPVYEDRGCQSCGSQTRAGSILAGGPLAAAPVASESQPSAPVSAPVPRNAQTKAPWGVVPGSARIVSVTDRVVAPATTAAESSEVVADASANSSQSPASDGWTTRRSTPDVLR